MAGRSGDAGMFFRATKRSFYGKTNDESLNNIDDTVYDPSRVFENTECDDELVNEVDNNRVNACKDVNVPSTSVEGGGNDATSGSGYASGSTVQQEFSQPTVAMEAQVILPTQNEEDNAENSPPFLQRNDTLDDLENGEEEEITTRIQKFEDIIAMIGPWGRWNIIVFVLSSACTFMSPLQIMSYEFLGATPNYWCHVDALYEANWTVTQILSLAIPQKNSTWSEGNEGCVMYDYDYDKAAAIGFDTSKENLSFIANGDPDSVIHCYSRDFNLSQYRSTVVTEWDLVCERRALYSTIHATSSLGNLLGSVVSGFLYDYIGRRPTVLGGVILSLLFGLGASLATTFMVYLILKFLVCATMAGIYLGSFMMVMELCSPSQRSSVGALFLIPWAFGYMAVPGIAYVIREWRWLQAAYTLPIVTLLVHFWILPESPRWLIERGRYQEALNVISRAASTNGNTLPSSTVLLAAVRDMDLERSTEEPKGVITRITHCFEKLVTLLIYQKLRFRTIVIYICWLGVSLIYFGLSLNSTNLSADPYLYMFFGGLVELPSYIFLWPAIAYLGRRATLATLYAVCAVSIAAVSIIMFFHLDVSVSVTMILSLGGKMAVTSAFHLLYVYTAELYSTKFRSMVITQANAISRIGSLVAPYIIDILGEVVGWAPSAVFAITAIVVVFLALLLPETKGTNLTEGDAIEVVDKKCTDFSTISKL